MWHRYSESLRETIFRSDRIAQSENSRHLSTRHLLVGLASGGAASQILRRLGNTDALIGTLPDEWETTPGPDVLPGLTPLARRAVDLSYQEAAYLHDQRIDTEHLLLALFHVPESEAAKMLATRGITRGRVAQELIRLQTWRTQLPQGVDLPLQGTLMGRKVVRAIRERFRLVQRIVGALSQLSNDPVVRSFLFRRQRLSRPYLFFRRLRERGLYFSHVAGGWVISSYEDAQALLREPMLSARRFDLALLAPQGLPPLIEREFNTLCGGLSRQMLFQDAPEQTHARSLVSRQFTPKVLATIRTRIQETADRLLDTVGERREMDLIADFAFPLPATVIARLLGVDDRDLTQFKTWSDAFVHFISGQNTLEQDVVAYESLRSLVGYFQQAVSAVRQSPENTTLLSLLANAEDDEGNRLTDEEVTMNAMLLLAAGHETTTHLIGNGLWLLFQYPEVLQQLRADPTLMPGAIEEMLRHEGPVQWTSRIATKEFSYKGHSIRRGDFLNIALAAANRDPTRFSDPDVFDIGRKENRHLAFGSGPHFCLGAALARMEADIALNTLLRRFPNIRPKGKEAQWRHDFTFRAQRRLDVLLD